MISPKPPNPLEVKHKMQNPTHYIPAFKRREIYDYMSKVNVSLGNDTNSSGKI